jgi:LmbE family N-acetylglucosaminyl deacetylase
MNSKIFRFFPGLFILLILIGINNANGDERKEPRKCIMVFGAHADDVDEIAGGTFAKYIDNGYEGIYVCVTNNSAGCLIERAPGDRWGKDFTVSNSPQTYPVGALETIQIRNEEARRAAKVFGAIPVFLDFRETWYWQGRKRCYIGTEEFHQYQPPGRQIVSVATRLAEDIDAVYQLLSQYQPEITIIHTLGGEKHDHGNSAYIMYQAFKKAMAEGIPVGKMWMTVNGWLLDDDAQNSERGMADVQIDVKDYLEKKYEALDMHLSQNGGYGQKYVKRNKVQPKEIVEEFITVIDNMK